nr:MAG TPA: hypothetical protein [Caudoviricetes sp.]DAJ57287.1 MAG TPA: hypothetical protein [Caudoviricetes sp.]
MSVIIIVKKKMVIKSNQKPLRCLMNTKIIKIRANKLITSINLPNIFSNDIVIPL